MIEAAFEPRHRLLLSRFIGVFSSDDILEEAYAVFGITDPFFEPVD